MYLWFGSYSQRHMISKSHYYMSLRQGMRLTLAMPIGEAASDIAGAMSGAQLSRSQEVSGLILKFQAGQCLSVFLMFRCLSVLKKSRVKYYM